MDTELIGKSWDALGEKQREFINTFYHRFLEKYPQYKPLFPSSRDAMDKLMDKVVRTMALVARIAGDTEILHPQLMKLGQKHRRLNLSKEDLENFKEIFLETLSDFCEEKCMTVWAQAFDEYIIPYMVYGLEYTMSNQYVKTVLKSQTSTRNQFLGTVSSVIHNDLNAEVVVKLRGEEEFVAEITTAGLKRMGLKEGMKVYVLIRAPQIMLMHADSTLKVSSRNVMRGRIVDSAVGANSVRVMIEMQGGSVIHSIVTKEAAEELGIKEGERVCAFFRASDVVLAVST